MDSLLSSPSLERPEGTGKHFIRVRRGLCSMCMFSSNQHVPSRFFKHALQCGHTSIMQTFVRTSCADPKQLLRVMEAFWAAMKDGKAVPAPSVVKRQPGTRLPSAPQYDVAVAGGTLGILLATALQARGHRVAVIERRRLEGRLQGVPVRLHCHLCVCCLYSGVCVALFCLSTCLQVSTSSTCLLLASSTCTASLPRRLLPLLMQSGTLAAASWAGWWPAAC